MWLGEMRRMEGLHWERCSEVDVEVQPQNLDTLLVTLEKLILHTELPFDAMSKDLQLLSFIFSSV